MSVLPSAGVQNAQSAQRSPGRESAECQTGAAPCLVLTVYLLPGGNTAPGILMGYPDRSCAVSDAKLTVCLLPGITV